MIIIASNGITLRRHYCDQTPARTLTNQEEKNDNKENVTSYLIFYLNRKSNGTQSDRIEEALDEKHSFDIQYLVIID